MASNKNTPNMTVKHAKLKSDGGNLRIEYEVYRTERTGKIHEWIVPKSFGTDGIVGLFGDDLDLLEQIITDEADLAVWSKQTVIRGRKSYVWERVERLGGAGGVSQGFNPRYFTTDPIDRDKQAKKTNHINNNL